MKKKLAALIIGSLAVLTLAGCGGTGAAAPAGDTAAAADSAPAAEAASDTAEASSEGASLELKIGVSTAETDPRNIAAEQFAAEIEEKTGGALTAKVYPSGQLGADADLINSLALDSGTVDIIITDASNFATYEPLMGISALPFNFADFDQAWAFMDSDIEAEAEAGLIDQNMRVLAHYDNGFRCVTNSKGPVESPDDMKGMLIRTPENPVIMATMTALGANPQPLAFSELYQALQQGTYDAQENPIPVIYNNTLYEVQDYLSVT
ncbi:MAG: TRAP transporter substrate-binding protein, partial [Lachnospiraceae bacterium]|nr:TRAP transporter substrate-binding protein [Lachnospiraceae bacterium]